MQKLIQLIQTHASLKNQEFEWFTWTTKTFIKKSCCMMNYANDGNKTFIQSRSCKKYCCERNDCAHPGETVFKCGKCDIWLCPTCSKKSMHMTLCMCPTNVDTNIKHIFVLESTNETSLQAQPLAFKYLFAYAKKRSR